MEQGIAVIFLVTVVAVKGATMYWLGQIQQSVAEARADDKEAQEKLNALDATKTQLEREKKEHEKGVEYLENEKNLLLVEVQKHGVKPVPEPSDDDIAGSEARATERPKPKPKVVEEGKGDVTAPEPDAEQAEPAEAEPTDAGAVPPNGRAEDAPRRILVVDDNTELRNLLRQALGKTYDVESAADGLEAMNVVIKQKREYDLVICDLNMPNVDGVTFLQHLPKRMPVIVISAYLDRADFNGPLKKIGPAAVMQKPFRLAEVKEAIERALSAPPVKPVAKPAVAQSDDEGEDVEETQPRSTASV